VNDRAACRAIDLVLARLRERFGAAAFGAVEQWDADLCAIGLATPGGPTYLAYISVCGKPVGRFDLLIEPATADAAAPRAGSLRHADIDFETLATIIAGHLGLQPPYAPI